MVFDLNPKIFINQKTTTRAMGIILDESIEATSILEAEDKTVYLLDLLKPILSKVVVAVVVLLIGFILGKLAGKTVQWCLRLLNLNKRCKELLGMHVRLEQFLSSTLAGAIYFITVIMALTVLGLSQIIVTILSVGFILLIFALIILSIKDFVPNYVDGVRIHNRLKEGDKIMIDNITGYVQDMTWTDIHVITQNSDSLYIPNSLFLKKGFKKLV